MQVGRRRREDSLGDKGTGRHKHQVGFDLKSDGGEREGSAEVALRTDAARGAKTDWGRWGDEDGIREDGAQKKKRKR